MRVLDEGAEMTAYDDLTDSSPESPAESLADQPGGAAQTPGEIGGSDDQVDPSGDPGGDTDLGDTDLADALGGADDETSEGPGVDSSDAERGNLDGSTPDETSREQSLDDAGDAVRDPSGASADAVGGDDLSSYTDAADSGQDNGLNE